MKIRHNCGVAGVFGNERAAETVKICLYQLQHRGQEAAGIASREGKIIHLHKAEGYVNDVFKTEILESLKGQIAIGHNRYATAGPSTVENAQPWTIPYLGLALCSNGDVVNYWELRDELEKKRVSFQSLNDGELITNFIGYYLSHGYNILDSLKIAFKKIIGAYSALMIYKGQLVAFRDPLGLRPLVIGKKENYYLVVSESCALDIVQADFLREVRPGEMIIFSDKEIKSWQIAKPKPAHCIFELIYFARPDSEIFGINAGDFREVLGKLLWLRHPLKADMVMPVPDSSNDAALGFHEASGIPFKMGLVRNHYVGRTFIMPPQMLREEKVLCKFNPRSSVIKEKKICVIDDSIVRGTTSRQLNRLLKKAGAKEIHLRISSPPIKHPCFYGIDMKTKKELIASQKSVEEIRKIIEADSLAYLEIKDLDKTIEIFGQNPRHFCKACFDGKYPTKTPNYF